MPQPTAARQGPAVIIGCGAAGPEVQRPRCGMRGCGRAAQVV